jgi:Rod binding domain-containing protein
MNVTALNSPAAPAQTIALSKIEHARAAGLTGGALRTASPAEQRAAVGAQFEAIFVRQLLGQTMAKLMGSADSTAGSVYGDLMTDTFAKSLTAGTGLGIGRMIEQQLTPRGVHALPAAHPAPAATTATTAAASTPAHP